MRYHVFDKRFKLPGVIFSDFFYFFIPNLFVQRPRAVHPGRGRGLQANVLEMGAVPHNGQNAPHKCLWALTVLAQWVGALANLCLITDCH
jgi:hypothetical protein